MKTIALLALLASTVSLLTVGETAFARPGDNCDFSAAKSAAALKAGMLKGLQQQKFSFTWNAASLTVAGCTEDPYGDDDGQGNWVNAIECNVQFKAADGTTFVVTNFTTSEDKEVFRIDSDYFIESQASDNEGNTHGPVSCTSSIESFQVRNAKSDLSVGVASFDDAIPLSYAK